MAAAKKEPLYQIEARRKRAELFDFYAAQGADAAKVSDLLGVDLVEAKRELAKRRGSA